MKTKNLYKRSKIRKPKMKANRTPISYKREKDKIEITGDPDDVKSLIWYHMITSTLLWPLRAIFFLKAPFIVFIYNWIKSKFHL